MTDIIPMKVDFDDNGHVKAVDFTTVMSHAEFLEHYGVPGMKWGKRNRAHNKEVLRKAGQDRIDRAGGSANKAVWGSIGKAALATFVSNSAVSAVRMVSKNNITVTAGAGALALVVQGVAAAKSINEIRAVTEAERSRD